MRLGNTPAGSCLPAGYYARLPPTLGFVYGHWFMKVQLFSVDAILCMIFGILIAMYMYDSFVLSDVRNHWSDAVCLFDWCTHGARLAMSASDSAHLTN